MRRRRGVRDRVRQPEVDLTGPRGDPDDAARLALGPKPVLPLQVGGLRNMDLVRDLARRAVHPDDAIAEVVGDPDGVRAREHPGQLRACVGHLDAGRVPGRRVDGEDAALDGCPQRVVGRAHDWDVRGAREGDHALQDERRTTERAGGERDRHERREQQEGSRGQEHAGARNRRACWCDHHPCGSARARGCTFIGTSEPSAPRPRCDARGSGRQACDIGSPGTHPPIRGTGASRCWANHVLTAERRATMTRSWSIDR